MNNHISERRIQNNKSRRRRQLRHQFLMLFATILLVFSFSVFGFSTKAKAQSASDAADISYKYYKSVIVNSGDTIWDYAELYAAKDYYESYDSYIREVVQINSLSNDDIQSGQYLILPYYSNEFIN